MMTVTKKTGFYYPISALVFAIASILGQFNAWFNEVDIHSIFLPLGVIFVAIPILYYVVNLAFKNKNRAEIFLTIFIVLFFSYSAIFNLHWSILFKIGNWSFGKDAFQVAIYLIVLGFAFSKLYKSKTDLLNFRLFLLRVSLIILIFTTVTVSGKIIHRVRQPIVKSHLDLHKTDSTNVDESEFPDIYFILPEDYAAPSIYKNYFNYDEGDFINFLKINKFYVAENATSNYPKSFESIASILNMEYLDYLSGYKNSSDYTLVNSLIDNNNVMKFLKSLGYSYYQIGSSWGPTHFNKFADGNFIDRSTKKMKTDYFLYNLADSTALSLLLGDSNHDDYVITTNQFKNLEETINLPGPKFVFTHIIAPHGPYVFDKNCAYITSKVTALRSETENYVNQTICINQKLKETISTIKNKSKQLPVIVIISDEGAPFIGNEIATRGDDWKNASNFTLKKKFPILTAIYAPEVSDAKLNNQITPVNIFRIIFNSYFRTDFPILSNKNYVFRDLKDLYSFMDVTEKIKN